MKEVTTSSSSMTADLQPTASQAILSRCFQSLSLITDAFLSDLLNVSHKGQLFSIRNSTCQFSYWNIQQMWSLLSFLPFIILDLHSPHQHSVKYHKRSSNEELPSFITFVNFSVSCLVLLYHFPVKPVLLQHKAMLMVPDVLNCNNIISDVKPSQSCDFFNWSLILRSLFSLHWIKATDSIFFLNESDKM